jgi:hypothetical protein
MKPDIEQFISLAGRNFSLIPLNGKRPFEKNWQQWCEEKRQFKPCDFDGHNAGICCGPASGLIVADVDDPQAFTSLNLSLPETFTVKTAKGFHYYFRFPENGNYGCKAFKHPVYKKHSVFDIRGNGGQVVAPGSIHPDTNEIYEIETDTSIALPPPWLIDFLNGGQIDDLPLWDVLLPDPAYHDFLGTLNLNEEKINQIIAEQVKGDRSEIGFGIILSLLNSGIDERKIFYLFAHYPIGQKFREKGKSKTNWLRGELERARNFVGIPANIERSSASDLPKGFTASELIRMEIPEPKYVISEFIPPGLTIIAGKPKEGKSILALNICVAVSLGDKAFDEIQVDKGGVIYLALEDTKRRLQDRLTDMLMGRLAPNNLVFFTDWKRMDQGGLDELENTINKIGMIRPTNRKRNKNLYEIDSQEVASTKALADKFDIAIVLIHHTRKQGSSDVYDTLSGSFGLTGSADTLIVLKRRTGQADASLHCKGRDVEYTEKALKLDTDRLTWVLVGDAHEVQSTPKRQTLFDAIKQSKKPLTPKVLTTITGFKYKYIMKTLDVFIEKGTVEKIDRGLYIYKGGDIEDKGDKGNIGDLGDKPTCDEECPTEGTKEGTKESVHLVLNSGALPSNVLNTPNIPYTLSFEGLDNLLNVHIKGLFDLPNPPVEGILELLGEFSQLLEDIDCLYPAAANLN